MKKAEVDLHEQCIVVINEKYVLWGQGSSSSILSYHTGNVMIHLLRTLSRCTRRVVTNTMNRYGTWYLVATIVVHST